MAGRSPAPRASGRNQRAANSALGPGMPSREGIAPVGSASPGAATGITDTRWSDYIASQLPATLAMPLARGASQYAQETLAFMSVGGVLQVTLLDGCRPNTTLDMRRSDLSYLPAAVPAEKSGRRGRGGQSRGQSRSQSPIGSAPSASVPIAAQWHKVQGERNSDLVLVLSRQGIFLLLILYILA
jgi:hypothetical protein